MEKNKFCSYLGASFTLVPAPKNASGIITKESDMALALSQNMSPCVKGQCMSYATAEELAKLNIVLPEGEKGGCIRHLSDLKRL